MDDNRLSFLLKRYHKGKCSEEEIRELQNWYESLNYPADADYALDEEEMLAELKAMVSTSKNKKRNIYRSVYRYAAVFACFLSIGLYFYVSTKKELPVKENKAVYIEGKIQSRKYTGKDGIERTAYEIICSEMRMLGGKSDDTDSVPTPPTKKDQTAPAHVDDFDDDIPFN